MPPIGTPSGIVPALSRPRSLIKAGSIILLGVSIFIYLLSLMDHDNWDFGEAKFGLLLDGISFPSIRNPDLITTRYCSAEEYASGQWVRRTNPPSTLDEIRELYGVKDHGRLECDPPGWPVAAKGTVPLDDPTHMARMLNHTRWMWIPGNDCHRREISEEAFVVRMLRSRTGLILVGDSLTEQHHEIVRNFLVSNDGPYQFRSHGGRPRVDQVFLNPSHELTKHYLRVSGVTADRLKNPITTFFLERHLLSLAEFDQVNAHVEGYVPLSEDDGPHQWVSESLWDARYREQLERPVSVTVEDELDGESLNALLIEEPSLLVLNTGPHWIAGEMSSKGVSDTDVLKSYNNMIEKVFHNLTANPSSNLKVYYRATSPGHISVSRTLDSYSPGAEDMRNQV
ncbi:hypothetical protein QFC19_003710 [Naganishia cerealis]|uniref:Uncharacterized protein n=1 Tax=Naganishia cerealis TaxID=610337 RepID=A0ACC2W0R6_9TREE|nr:hypothetical protein QFC19_003710 [Naganishia cerealis]